jgi:hypothetical protein
MSDIERRSPSAVTPVSAGAGVAAVEGPRLAKAVGVAVTVWFNRQFAGVAWAQELRRHVDFIVFGILAVVVAIAALVAVFQPTPRLAWYFQPGFQSLVAAVLGALVYLYARSRAVRENVDLAARARAQLPAE